MKYKGKRFGSMPLGERTKWTKGLIAKIAVITGWVVPYDEVLNILVDQFEKKLFETYNSVNPDEVEYAFRERGTMLEDWGKEINLSMIDKVMIPYLNKRFEVSMLEESKKTNPMLIENKVEMTDDDYIASFDSTALLVQKGTPLGVEIIPPFLYDWLDRNGYITASVDDKIKFRERAALARYSMIQNAFEKNPYSLETKQAITDFNKMREEKSYSKEEYDRIVIMAKKMIVFEMMKQDKKIK